MMKKTIRVLALTLMSSFLLSGYAVDVVASVVDYLSDDIHHDLVHSESPIKECEQDEKEESEKEEKDLEEKLAGHSKGERRFNNSYLLGFRDISQSRSDYIKEIFIPPHIQFS